VDEQTGAPVPSAKVIIKNKQDKTEQEYFADANGELEAVAREDAELEIRATRVGYFSTSRSKTAIKVPKGQKSMLETLKLLKLAEGGIIALEGIFYDLNKIEIRKDAAKVLDYVYQVLLENPTMVIEMGSHTDARDSDERNMKLSEGRAASAVAYIVAKGIEASRITSKGYGETQLKNKCGNGVKCPEAMHQENRRTEIRIVSFD
jgi:outer membrane protein OmpA-like peptidoglycan-associated protein